MKSSPEKILFRPVVGSKNVLDLIKDSFTGTKLQGILDNFSEKNKLILRDDLFDNPNEIFELFSKHTLKEGFLQFETNPKLFYEIYTSDEVELYDIIGFKLLLDSHIKDSVTDIFITNKRCIESIDNISYFEDESELVDIYNELRKYKESEHSFPLYIRDEDELLIQDYLTTKFGQLAYLLLNVWWDNTPSFGDYYIYEEPIKEEYDVSEDIIGNTYIVIGKITQYHEKERVHLGVYNNTEITLDMSEYIGELVSYDSSIENIELLEYLWSDEYTPYTIRATSQHQYTFTAEDPLPMDLIQ